MEGFTEGRMVHYVMTGNEPSVLGHVKGQHRAAVVVRVFDSGHAEGTANLCVFVDGINDMASESQKPDNLYGGMWRTSTLYSEGMEPGTWHWIERA